MKIGNVWIFNTPLRTFQKGILSLEGSRITRVEFTDEIDASAQDGQGNYVIPGLVDIHMHIESSMTTPTEFSNSVLPFGTTTVVADAHEVANVFGEQGLLDYMDHKQVLDVFYAIPSSVPSTNAFLESSGGFVDEAVVTRLCQHAAVIALGEVMNAHDLITREDTLTKRIIKAFRLALPLAPIEGHCPRIHGEALAAFIASGVNSDHTHQDKASILEKISAGMFLEIQDKSITEEVIATLVENELYDYFCFVTDDVMPDQLIKGHLNELLKKAVRLGMRMEDAIYCATYTSCQRMQRYDRGWIAPGKQADLIFLSDLVNFDITRVMKSGNWVFTKADGLLAYSPFPSYPDNVLHSIRREPLTVADLRLESQRSTTRVRAIERELTSTFTHEVDVDCVVSSGVIDWQGAGLNLLVVAERYGQQAPLSFGFMTNGFKSGVAMASSWAHDSHNILAMGRDPEKIAAAINEVIAMQGGMVLIDEAGIYHRVALPYGGIISLAPMHELADQLLGLRLAMQQAGYQSHNEIMSFATLSLLVSPALKLSDKGLIDVREQKILGYEI